MMIGVDYSRTNCFDYTSQRIDVTLLKTITSVKIINKTYKQYIFSQLSLQKMRKCSNTI